MPNLIQITLGESYLTRTQGRGHMTRVGVGGVLRPAEHVVHDPVQPPAKVVLGPALEVMQEELLCAFLKSAFMDVVKM